MSISIQEYAALKRKMEEAHKEYERSVGVLEELTRRLEKEFGISSIKEARRQLEKVKQELEHMREKCEIAKEGYEEQFVKKLNR